jgi:hypothetical protein
LGAFGNLIVCREGVRRGTDGDRAIARDSWGLEVLGLWGGRGVGVEMPMVFRCRKRMMGQFHSPLFSSRLFQKCLSNESSSFAALSATDFSIHTERVIRSNFHKSRV